MVLLIHYISNYDLRYHIGHHWGECGVRVQDRLGPAEGAADFHSQGPPTASR